jgi:sensor histidine kinase YesM
MFLIWSAIGALTVARAQLRPSVGALPIDTLAVFVACMSWYFPWAVLSPMVFRLEQRFPLGAPGWPRRLGILALTSLPVCIAIAPVMSGLDVAIRYVTRSQPLPVHAGLLFFGTFPVAEGLFWCSVGGGYLFRTLSELHEQKHHVAQLALDKSQLEASLNHAQLEVLRARLNPHFLFNSLQNISVLITEDAKTASRMVVVLGDLLRAVLRRDSEPESTLAEEVDLTRSYVAVEQMRFADRLRVTFDVEREVGLAIVPCFLMQPLLENAIIHGLEGTQKNGVISVRAAGEKDRLVITVTDNGVGPPAESDGMKLGVGLGSTCERLTRMYPKHHEFSIQRLPEGGAEVRIAIPLKLMGRSGNFPPDE